VAPLVAGGEGEAMEAAMADPPASGSSFTSTVDEPPAPIPTPRKPRGGSGGGGGGAGGGGAGGGAAGGSAASDMLAKMNTSVLPMAGRCTSKRVVTRVESAWLQR